MKVQHAEPIAEKNLYTILGFKSGEDFENKINRLVNKEIWQLFVNVFEKEIGYAANKEVVKNIICNIAKSHRGNAFIKTEHIILNEKQGSKKGEKAIKKAIGILKEMNAQKALEELSIMKEQAEGFLQSDFYQAQSKQLQGFAPSGAQLFEKTLQYIKSLEKLSAVKKDELVKGFLENHVKSLNKNYPKLQDKITDVIAVLSSGELREAYNEGIEEGTLLTMASYKECKRQFDKANEIRNGSKAISETKELETDIEGIDGLMKNLIESTDDIVKSKEAILNCKDLQSSYIKEKEEHPFRGTSCQKMIDIYQGRIVEYHEQVNRNLNQAREMVNHISQATKNLPDIKEFQKVICDIYKQQNTQEVKETIGSALNYLANAQNKMYIQLENPSTDLRASHIHSKTEVTRL
ncbi:hypothetical protein ASM33_03465 [Wolbachia endosymbiont of Folsomia candida]|nr:hypothetical protein ASM33_03465 [Wolbachia endosymbiont of Folsomia candida]